MTYVALSLIIFGSRLPNDVVWQFGLKLAKDFYNRGQCIFTMSLLFSTCATRHFIEFNSISVYSLTSYEHRTKQFAVGVSKIQFWKRKYKESDF